jgi:hypothetical protein
MPNKINLNNLTNLQNEQSAVNIINNNNDALETWSDTVLSTDGSTPNVMNAQLDMNSNHIINLPIPVVDTEPVRLIDIANITSPSTGNVTSIASPVGGELTQYSGSSGTIVTDYGNTGLVKTTAGIPSSATAGTDYYAPASQIIPITEGGTGQTTALAAFNTLKQQSTTSYQGTVQLATGAEAITGTDPNKALTPATFSSAYNAAIPNSLLPYSKIIRTVSAAPSTNYTLVLADQGNIVISNAGSAVTFTIPTNASVAFTGGGQIDFLQNNTGKVTFAGASGVTILSKGSNKSMNGLYSACTLVYAGTNFWWLFGDLTA